MVRVKHAAIIKRWSILGTVVALMIAVSALLVISMTGGPTTKTADPAPRAVTAREAAALDLAEQRLTGQCMRRLGFRYWTTPAAPALTDDLFPYVIDDPGWASRHGYGTDVQAAFDRARTTNPNGRYVSTLPSQRQTAYSAALNGRGASDPGVRVTLPYGEGTIGHSSAGCSAQAEDALYGDFGAWFTATTMTEYLKIAVESQVAHDPRFGRAVAAWSRCMRSSGHPYASPQMAHLAFLSGANPPPRRVEIATATAEARCAISIGLATTARRLDAAFTTRLPATYQSVLTADRRLALDALKRIGSTAQAG